MWLETDSGYELSQGHDFNARIVFSMSNQLWYDIPLDYFTDEERIAAIEVPIDSLGHGLLRFVESRTRESHKF